MNFTNTRSYTFIEKWLTFAKYNKQTNPDITYKKSLLISGPSGIGKSTCLYALLHKHNYSVTEFNLLDLKNHKYMKSQLNDILYYKNIHSLFMNTVNNKIIIFNEIDKISVSERSIINNVILYIQSKKKSNTYIPIIFKGNNHTSFFKHITEVASHLQFPLPTENNIYLFCKEYIHKHTISLSDIHLTSLIKTFRPNFRIIKHNLDMINFYINKHPNFSLSDITKYVKNNQTDIDIDIYQSVYELLNTKLDNDTCEHIMSKDSKYILLLLHKNIPSYLQYNTKNTFTNKINHLASIYSYINFSTNILYHQGNCNSMFLFYYINSTLSIIVNSIINDPSTHIDYGKFNTIRKSAIYSKLNYKFCNLKYIRILSNKCKINTYNFQLFSHYIYYLLSKYNTKKCSNTLYTFCNTYSILYKELDKILKLSYINKWIKKKNSYKKIYKLIMEK
jgi:DNA polymerase III delta prime subunit